MLGRWSQARLCIEAHPTDDLLCAQWCTEIGLLRAMPLCTTHQQDRTIVRRANLHLNRDHLFWRCSRCKDQISIRNGSIFNNVKLSLGKTLMLIMCFAQGQIIEDARRALMWSSDASEIAVTTVVRLYDRLRARIAEHVSTQGLIGGPGIIVQIDEALIGRRKYNRGRLARGTWVLGMIAENGDVRFEIIENRSAVTLEAVIVRNVAIGSIIHTDEWRAYSRLCELGYTHATVNHSERFVSPEGVHTQRIESQWRQIRRVTSRGGIHHDDIKSYLAEYVWRRGCRFTHTDTFNALLQILRAEE